jgi:hypothetical protein
MIRLGTVLFFTAAMIVFQISPSQMMSGQAESATHVDNFAGRPRVIVMSDIGNEPDDQMSLITITRGLPAKLST